jgi:hypothetical protein
MRSKLDVLLNATQARAVRVILEAPQAWCPVRCLEKRGHSSETLNGLQKAGWIAPWFCDREGNALNYPSWALTPWAARRLGKWIVEERGVPKWNGTETAHSERVIARPPRRGRRLIFPDQVEAQAEHRGRRARYIGSRYWNETTLDPDRAERLMGAPVELVDSF